MHCENCAEERQSVDVSELVVSTLVVDEENACVSTRELLAVVHQERSQHEASIWWDSRTFVFIKFSSAVNVLYS